MKVYLVGGAVRDEMLQREVVERDWVVVGATPEKLLEQGFQQVGKDFPVFLHPQTKEEYALARTERKSAAGYTGFECHFDDSVTLEQDLIRRDLTINAMAKDDAGKIIDPYGGEQDLSAKLLRHVSGAFVEDPLRVLRVARFAARYHSYGFSVAEETKTLMQQIVKSGELDALTAERVWKETVRALAEPHPEIYFQCLRDCGSLKVLLPELNSLWGIPNPKQWHPEVDTGIHTMMVLQQARKLTSNTEVLFAALVHDVGKAKTDSSRWPRHFGHENLGLDVIKDICERLKVPNSYKQLAFVVCEYHTHCHRAFEMRPNTIIKMFDAMDLWRKRQRLDDFLLSCLADYKGRTGYENKEVPQIEFIRQAFDVAFEVDVQQVIADGFKGADIRQQLTLRRIAAVKEFKENYSLEEA